MSTAKTDPTVMFAPVVAMQTPEKQRRANRVDILKDTMPCHLVSVVEPHLFCMPSSGIVCCDLGHTVRGQLAARWPHAAPTFTLMYVYQNADIAVTIPNTTRFNYFCLK